MEDSFCGSSVHVCRDMAWLCLGLCIVLLMKSGGLGSRMSGRSSSDGPKATISGDQNPL